MKPPDKKSPEIKGVQQLHVRAGQPHQFKPPVAQTKNAAHARHAGQPAPRPPAFKQQPNGVQPKIAGPSQPITQPPAYRPQQVPRCLQLKADTKQQPHANEPRTPRPAPPVYRPQPTQTAAQLKRPNQAAQTKPATNPPHAKALQNRPLPVKPPTAVQRQSAEVKRGAPAVARGFEKKPDIKQAVAPKGQAQPNTIQRYLVINTGNSKFHYTYKFPPDNDDLRVGYPSKYATLKSSGAMPHLLAVFKEWGRKGHGFVEFKGWKEAVSAALKTDVPTEAAKRARPSAAAGEQVEAVAQEAVAVEAKAPKKSVKASSSSSSSAAAGGSGAAPAKDEDKKELNWVWNSDYTWQHTFKKHGSRQKKALVQRAKRPDKGKQGMWLDDAKAAEYLKSVRNKLGDKAANIPIPAGLGIEIQPDGKELAVTRANVVPCPWSGGYTSGYPTSDVTIKNGNVIAAFPSS